jgi:hypothetical protein
MLNTYLPDHTKNYALQEGGNPLNAAGLLLSMIILVIGVAIASPGYAILGFILLGMNNLGRRYGSIT